MIIKPPSRRGLILGGAAALAGCDQLQQNSGVTDFIRVGEKLSKGAQRIFLSAQPLAREFKPSDISPTFRANGSTFPRTQEYMAHFRTRFSEWQLAVFGMVTNPAAYTLAQLKAMPARTQITRHDCVEGWSAIGQWTGVPLRALLAQTGVTTGARYAVMHCADVMNDGAQYYESIDLFDAFHPQTILAYDLNGKTLPIANGAPLRLRVERQLGYKQAKYVMGIELTNSLAKFWGGRGGYWEDRGYEWYAGI
jgi:DMSO/TMAO reductase YedYZ molybdopterin-dependent catalytic subunit